jgi:hypothetical protein
MVAVKGMKMPKSCMECLLFDDEYGDCNIMGEPKANMTEERAKNCPLVEIVTCEDCKFNDNNTCAIDGFEVEDDYFCGCAESEVD